jgi:molybdopterin molybdotransferase
MSVEHVVPPLLHTIEEAQARLLALARPVQRESVPLAEAHARWLHGNVHAVKEWPLFDHSTMDGYAIAAPAALSTMMLRLHVDGEHRAGGTIAPLLAGCAMRIFTGAPVPSGANCVVMQEQATRKGDEVTLRGPFKEGAFIRKRGEDFHSGALALNAGTRLDARHISLLAMLDHANVTVVKRPRVAIVTTGDELRPPGIVGEACSIPESNGPGLRVLIEQCGARVTHIYHAKDESAAMQSVLRAAASEADVVITVGGVSVGDHDLVRPSLAAMGATLLLYRVAMRPGKPLSIATWKPAAHADECIFVGLPGNPVSAFVTFTLFAAPLLRALSGAKTPDCLPAVLLARLEQAVKPHADRVEFLRVQCRLREGSIVASPLVNQASGGLFALAQADALARIPAGTEEVAQYSWVEVLPLQPFGAQR